MRSRTVWPAVTWLMVVVAAVPVFADAEAALNRARALARQGHFSDAINVLRQELRTTPNNADLNRSLGEAYLSLRLYDLAIPPLQRARKLGDDSPALFYAMGVARLGLRQYASALAELKRGPDTAARATMLAMALVNLNRPAEALEQLERARELDKSVEPKVRMLRAQALAMIGRIDEARAEVQDGIEENERTPLVNSYRRLGAALDQYAQRRPSPRDWGVQLTLGVGHNDNVVLRPDEASGLLAQQLADEDDVFFIQQLNGWKRLLGDQRQGLTAQAGVTALEHSDLSDYNQLYVTAGLLAHTQLQQQWRADGGINVDYANVDGDDFGVTGSVHGTLRWSQADWTRSNLGYRFSYRDYVYDVLSEEDHDGPLHLVRFSQDVFMGDPGRRLHIAPFVEFGREDAEGASVQNSFWGLGAGARCQLTDRLSAFASGGYRERDYDHPSVRTGFARARDDEQWRVGAGLRYDVAQHAYVTFSWNRTDNDSNIPEFFSYDQSSFVLAITVHGP